MNLYDFVQESNRIEGIHKVRSVEIDAHVNFLESDGGVAALEKFVDIVAGAPLRSRQGMDVRVGTHYPPPGGPMVVTALGELLDRTDLDPWERHVAYETLHPFMDGNGRSGRVLWLRDMGGQAPIGFLHRFYYQTLDHTGIRRT